MARGRRPKARRGGLPDQIVADAWNPTTGKNDLEVRVSGERLDFFVRHSLMREIEAVRNIPDTVRAPDCVFRSKGGSFVYCRSIRSLSHVPLSLRRSTPDALFVVSVRSTGARAFRWQFEDSDPGDPQTPLDTSGDRFTDRIK